MKSIAILLLRFGECCQFLERNYGQAKRNDGWWNNKYSKLVQKIIPSISGLKEFAFYRESSNINGTFSL
jgi:hypothetical protein